MQRLFWNYRERTDETHHGSRGIESLGMLSSCFYSRLSVCFLCLFVCFCFKDAGLLPWLGKGRVLASVVPPSPVSFELND